MLEISPGVSAFDMLPKVADAELTLCFEIGRFVIVSLNPRICRANPILESEDAWLPVIGDNLAFHAP